MKRDFLTKLGLTKETLEKAELGEDVIDKIMAENGKDIEATRISASLKASEFEEENGKLKAQLAEAQKQMDQFKGMKTPEEVENAVKDWKLKVAEAERAHTESVLALKRTHTMERVLKEEFKAKNVKAVVALLNQETLKFDEKEEKFIGLKEQIEPLIKSDPYLFSTGKEAPRFSEKSETGNNEKPLTFAGAIQERLANQT